MSSKNLILVDRSRSVTDWRCERQRYLNYELDGKGIVTVNEPIELMMGTALHTGLADIATQWKASGEADIDTIASRAAATVMTALAEREPLYMLEQGALVEGLLRGFYRYQWPKLMALYPKILAVEQEMSYEYGSLLFMVKPDLVVADTKGGVVYVEHKSTSSKKDEWVNSWNTAVQLHSTTRAIEHALGEEIDHIVIQGLYKGYYNFGKQNSPMCYANKRPGNPPFSKDEVSYDWRAGFKKSPAWELEGGIKGWVDKMPAHILADQFLMTPPIFVNDDLVENFFAQRLAREQEIQLALQMMDGADDDTRTHILNTAFSQRFDQCSPAYGKGCPYKRICHGAVPRPLESGFIYRTPHHAHETDAQAAVAAIQEAL